MCSHRTDASGHGLETLLKAVLLLGAGLGAAGLLVSPRASAQQPKGAAGAADLAAQRDLITRYRFSERYTTQSGGTTDGAVGQYRVAMKETQMQTTGDLGRDGQINRIESAMPPKIQHIIYNERPAEVSSLGQVKTLVRNYEKAQVLSDAKSDALGTQTIEGMTIWLKPRPDDMPEVICLSENRQMRDGDYMLAAKQLFVPTVASILPTTPIRVGDSWPLSRLGVRFLVGGDRVLQGGLDGKLTDVRVAQNGSDRLAIMEITGRILMRTAAMEINIGVRAEVQFAFTVKVAEGGQPEMRDEGIVDAKGAIVRLTLAQAGTVPAAPGRKAQSIRRELQLERQLINTTYPLEIPHPDQLPKPTPENSWLTYVDPQKRFYFRHPQDLYRPQDWGMPATSSSLNQIDLIHWRPAGRIDIVRMELNVDALRKPEDVRESVIKDWKEKKFELLEGGALWLPEAQWPGMRTFRYEMALLPPGRGAYGLERIHFDGYVIHFRPEATLVASATTPIDPPTRFRRDVETMLKSFRFGSPDPAPH